MAARWAEVASGDWFGVEDMFAWIWEGARES